MSIHNKKQSLVTDLSEIVTVFEKSTQNLAIFYFKIAKSCSATGGSSSRPPVFMYCSYTDQFKQIPASNLHALNEIIKLCDQLCFPHLKIHVV